MGKIFIKLIYTKRLILLKISFDVQLNLSCNLQIFRYGYFNIIPKMELREKFEQNNKTHQVCGMILRA